MVKPELIISSIAKTLANDVQPALKGGWPASYLRSALVLLTYLEDRLTLGDKIMYEDDGELRSVLEVGASALDHPDADQVLAGRLRKVATANGELEVAHGARRAALCDLIVAVYERPDTCKGASAEQLTSVIAHYRDRSMARDERLWQRAAALPVM